jgi:purine-nucleoside/S-methyl-5'-thioadenosine phosphorylase / adenosine deaminase
MSNLLLIRWDAPGPYRVAFSTRVGGVSEDPYASLNLGIMTGDEPARVLENRRRLCKEVGVDAERGQMAWQQHGAVVREAEPKGLTTLVDRPACDGLWSEEPGVGMLLVAADCLPIALARIDGGRAGLAVLHAGWKGLLGGIVSEGTRALDGRVAAVIGPGIGPCCYEVRADVADPYRAAFGRAIVRDGRLDMWTAAERALRDAGCESVERTDLCTACHPDLFFSHRRDGARTGRQGILGAVG